MSGVKVVFVFNVVVLHINVLTLTLTLTLTTNTPETGIGYLLGKRNDSPPLPRGEAPRWATADPPPFFRTLTGDRGTP